MSSIYITEPMTSGKVVLKTSVGDMDIELWSKETPKTCRNFVQLCMEGYYDNTIFHRVIKDFMVQGGDPTGTGEGGESIYGGEFADELHSRLRFSHRGIVAMASSGRDTNRSQFFITFDATPELQRKHTIFGKITGDTIFNVLKINEFEVDENDRPSFPPKILSVEVVWNPFDDIIPREQPKVRELETAKPAVDKRGATKNFGLLSFGDEAEEEEQELAVQQTKMASSYAFPSKLLEESRAKKRRHIENADAVYDLPEDYLKKKGSKTEEQPTNTKTKKEKKRAKKQLEEEDDEVQQATADKGAAKSEVASKQQEAEDSDDDDDDDDDDSEEEQKVAGDVEFVPKPVRNGPKLVSYHDEGSEGESDEDSDEEGKPKNRDKKAVDFSELMRAKMLEKKKQYDTTPVVKKKPKEAPAAPVVPSYIKPTYKKLRLKKKEEEPEGGTVDTAIGHTEKRKSFRRGMQENEILAKLEKFKSTLKATPAKEEEEWKGHALQFEKEKKVIDPMRRGEEEYTFYDPLKDARVGSAAALMNKPKTWHERRLDHTEKKLDEW